MPAILIAVILLILYGSLYPWVFHFQNGPANPLAALFHARSEGFSRRFVADILINLALYVPVGVSAYLSIRKSRPFVVRIVIPILLGFALSISIEMTQFYVPIRSPSLLDLVNNTIGSALGVLVGFALETLGGRELRIRAGSGKVDHGAVALLLIWTASMLFPLFPVMWLPVYRQKLVQLAAAIQIPSEAGLVTGAVTIMTAALSWYAAGLMLESLAIDKKWLWGFTALVPAQMLVLTRLPSFAAFFGAVAGTLVFIRFRHRNIAWLFVMLLILLGLWPFHFGPRHGVSLIPFKGFLEMQWQTGIRILLEKGWYFGAAIWLLWRSNSSLRFSTLVVAGVAAVIELSQMYLPGRTPEITDPLLVLLLGLVLHSLRR